MEIDQPNASRFLAYSRHHGTSLPWRQPADGLVTKTLCTTVFGKDTATRFVKDSFFSSPSMGDLRELRRVSRHNPHRIAI